MIKIQKIRWLIAAFGYLMVAPLFSQMAKTFEVGLNAGYGFNYRSTRAVDDFSKSYMESRNSREIGSFLPQYGVSFSWLPNHRWKFQGGLRWTSRGLETKEYVLPGQGADSLKASYSMRVSYLEIPIMVRYNFIRSNKWKAFVSASISFGKALNSKDTYNSIYPTHTESNSREGYLVEPNSFSFSGAAGVNYAFLPKFNLDFMLEYQQNLLPAYGVDPYIPGVDSAVKTYFWALIPKIGLNYKL